jgi:hypothetical protein
MKALIKLSGKQIFRNTNAIELYNNVSKNSDIIEYGKDTKDNIYFAWANGNIDRYSRKEFLAMSNVPI